MKFTGQAKPNAGLRQWGPVLPSTKKKTELSTTTYRANPESKVAQKVEFGSHENDPLLKLESEIHRLSVVRSGTDKQTVNSSRQTSSVERTAVLSSGRSHALRERVNRLHKDDNRQHNSVHQKDPGSLMQSQNFTTSAVPLKKASVPIGRTSATKAAVPQRFHRDTDQLTVEVRERQPFKNSPDPKVSTRSIPVKPLEEISAFEMLTQLVRPPTPRRTVEEPQDIQQGSKPKLRRSRNSSRSSLMKAQPNQDDLFTVGQLRTCPLSLNAAKILQGSTRGEPLELTDEIEQSRTSDDSDCTLTPEEEKNYGKRFMPGYDKIKLLGKGGQALVWLGRNLKSGQLVAVKQIVIGGYVNEKGARKEIELSELIFNQNDTEYITKIGKHSIANIRDHISTKTDLFMAMDVGGSSLSKWIYSMKGVFLKSERIYKITHNKLYLDIRKNFSLLKKLMTQLLVGLHVLNERGIVHCDMKPENILVKYNPQEQNTEDVKIIDFGASFIFDGQPFLTVTTPEYLPPEFLQLFSQKKAMNNKQKHDWLKKHSQPWSIDVWGLGVILIECLIGVPVWMSFKCQTIIEGKEQIRLGLFSSPARDNDKIADKMIKFVPGIRKKLRDMIGDLPHIDLVTDLLEKMLSLDPNARPSPAKLLSHPLFEINE